MIWQVAELGIYVVIYKAIGKLKKQLVQYYKLEIKRLQLLAVRHYHDTQQCNSRQSLRTSQWETTSTPLQD